MKCYIHAEREAMSICTACGKFICSQCHVELDKKATCINCIKKKMDTPEKRMMSKKSVVAILLLVFIFVSIFGSLPWYGFFPVIATLFGLTMAVFMFHKRKVKSSKIKKIEFKETPIEEVNEEQAELKKLSRQLEDLAYSFRGTKIYNQVLQISETTNKIEEFVRKYPHKLRNLNKFSDYYLPTTIKLLENYKQLSGKRGENIDEATRKIETLLLTLEKAYAAQLDSLFEDKAMDIDAEIKVLTGIMEKEGLL